MASICPLAQANSQDVARGLISPAHRGALVAPTAGHECAEEEQSTSGEGGGLLVRRRCIVLISTNGIYGRLHLLCSRTLGYHGTGKYYC